MNKFKITYNDYGTIKAKIIESDWYSVINDAQFTGNNIQQDQILKIELMADATDYNTEDFTQDA